MPILCQQNEKAWQSNCSGQINLETIHCAKLTNPNASVWTMRKTFVNVSSPLEHPRNWEKVKKKNLFFLSISKIKIKNSDHFKWNQKTSKPKPLLSSLFCFHWGITGENVKSRVLLGHSQNLIGARERECSCKLVKRKKKTREKQK